ncbi:hypothetical protein Tco_0063314, partial [Tanacetum coccineum]
FDELTAMASEHGSLEPALHEMTLTTISSGLVSNPTPSTLYVPGNGYSTKRQKTQPKGQNQARNWKERKKSKSTKVKVKSRPKSQPRQSQSQTEAETEENLSGPPDPFY